MAFTQVFRLFAVAVQIVIRCILFVLIFLVMCSEFDLSPPVANRTDWTSFRNWHTLVFTVHTVHTAFLNKNQDMKSKEVSVDLCDKILCWGTDQGKGITWYKTISLGVHRTTVAWIIVKWNNFETTTTLLRDGCPDKLSDRTSRASGRWPRTQWPI